MLPPADIICKVVTKVKVHTSDIVFVIVTALSNESDSMFDKDTGITVDDDKPDKEEVDLAFL